MKEGLGKKLEENKHFLQTIVDAIPSPVFYKDTEGRYLGCNQTFAKWFGIEQEDIVGKSVFELTPPDLAQKYYEKDKELFDNPNEPQVYEASVQPKNDSLRKVEFHKSVFFDSDGKIGGLVGTIYDITERKKAEEEILIFRRFAEASGQGFAMLRHDRKIEYLNPTLISMLRFDISLLVNENQEDLLKYCPQSGHSLLLDTIIPQVFSSGQWTGEMELIGGDERLIPVISNFFLIRDAGSEPLHVAVVFTDISKQKKMEDQQQVLLRQGVESLKDAEEEREKAESANRLKSEFLANMSHELRTPLASVLGYSALSSQLHNSISLSLKKLFNNLEVANGFVKEWQAGDLTNSEGKSLQLTLNDIDSLLEDASLENSESTNFLDVVNRQGEKLLALINDLLDLSHIEAGYLKLNHQTVSAKILLSSVFMTISPVADEKGIVLKSNIDRFRDKDLLFYGDKKRLEQVLQNLIENGIKYSDEGSVTVNLSESDGILLMVVTDEGIGFSEEEKLSIFESFYQLDGSLTRSRGGVGLGLALVRKLVSAMGGKIDVDSKKGVGSSFTVTLPFNAGDLPSVVKGGDRGLIALSGKKFLVIDDDLNNKNLLGAMLAGNDVAIASNGREALDALAMSSDFDAILLDIHMPIMSGTEMLEHLPFNFSIPIVVVSADLFNEKEVEVRMLASERNLTLDYMSKPFSKKELLTILSKLGVS